jgi:hypothetical protein
MKVYISGDTTCSPYKIRKLKFDEAEDFLKKLKYDPVNPFNLKQDSLAPWPQRLEVLSSCEAIFLLADWLYCSESKVEKYYCSITGKEILFESRIHSEISHYSQVESEVIRISGAIHEVTGMRLEDYADGPRTEPKYFCRVLFSIQCKRGGIDPEDIAFRYIQRDRTTILHYLKKYPDEFKFNHKFREIAAKVNNMLYLSRDPADSLMQPTISDLKKSLDQPLSKKAV